MARTVAASDALETLVRQFSQPLAFLRELIQNSLDANTNRVDVVLHHDAGEGCAVVEVVDTGEGMTREIIDERLTCLFSSTKENDFTKIGKFGIGFVSVFAIKPKLVVVDTGRQAESWRILFKPDRSFERVRLQQPVEGTRVTVYVPCSAKRFAAFEQDCHETVVYWCKHCDIDVAFNGQTVNQPFALDAPFQVNHREGGTEVVVAPSFDRQPYHAFYNRGLTLLEGRGSPLAGVAFKVRSHYLEHTLTRDNVLQDENYEKALDVVKRAAYQELPHKLFEELAARTAPDLWRAAAVAAAYPDFERNQAQATAVFPCLDQVTRALRDLPARVPFAPQADLLAEAVMREEIPILQADEDSPALELLKAAGREAVALEKGWFVALPVVVEQAVRELFEATRPLVAAAGLRHLELASLDRVPTHLRGRLCLWCRDLNRAEPESQALVSGRSSMLAVAYHHPLIDDLKDLFAYDPQLAAYLLGRALCLESGCEAEVDGDLFSLAMKGRRKSPPDHRLPRRRKQK